MTVPVCALLQHKRGIRKFKTSIGWTQSPHSFLDYFQKTVSCMKLNKLGISQVQRTQTVQPWTSILTLRAHKGSEEALHLHSTPSVTVIREMKFTFYLKNLTWKPEKQYLVGDATLDCGQFVTSKKQAKLLCGQWPDRSYSISLFSDLTWVSALVNISGALDITEGFTWLARIFTAATQETEVYHLFLRLSAFSGLEISNASLQYSFQPAWSCIM